MKFTKWMKSKSKLTLIVLLMLITCLQGSNRQDIERVTLQNAFEFLAENETYFDNVPSDIVNSYFYMIFERMLELKISRTGKWLFCSSRELQQEQWALVEELSESMDGSDISREHENAILTNFEHYLERWIRVLKEHGQ